MKLRSGTNTSQPTIGYKIAKADGIRVVVTLEIPEDALTNINRNNVAVKEYAKHRCNKAKVIKIEDENGKEYTSAKSFNYDKKALEYILNDVIVVDEYDRNLENVCSTGIHFFLTRHCAELYRLPSIKNGPYQTWHENGQKSHEYTYMNGKQHGLYQRWHENGQKSYECEFVNGQIHGLYQRWDSNGDKIEESQYENGVKV